MNGSATTEPGRSSAALKRAESQQLPHRWMWLLRLFRWYSARYIRKHLHALRITKSGSPFPPATDRPLIVVLNHPSWWDPLVCLALSRQMPHCDHFAAIDATAVQRYRFFTRLGFIGVDSSSLRGAAEFLRTASAILSQPRRAFWLTAQGRFTDVRERPLALQSGVGHMAARLPDAVVLPIAVEYAFWSERTAEALVCVGEPISVADHPGLTGKAWTALIEAALTRTLDRLNADAMSRDPGRFTTLIAGKSGVGGVYDFWRRLKARLRGRAFDPAHAPEAERPTS